VEAWSVATVPDPEPDCGELAANLPHKMLTEVLCPFKLKNNVAFSIESHRGKNSRQIFMMEAVMKRIEFEQLSTDDLWSLHVEVSQLLQQRIQAEKLRLEERLKLLRAPVSDRRSYPPVLPKYRNPDQPLETWAGRGRQPRWLVAQLRSGKRIDDFKIKKVANRR
jgi:DNA-binding protein H-NS